jgi:membrane protein implicated in regulation of membrane protease activity
MFFTTMVLAPLAHGAIGPLDELALIVAPAVAVITVIVWKLFHRQWDNTSHRSRSRSGKNDKRTR